MDIFKRNSPPALYKLPIRVITKDNNMLRIQARSAVLTLFTFDVDNETVRHKYIFINVFEHQFIGVSLR